MKKTVIAVIVFSVWFGMSQLAPAQPFLERLEQRIRDRVNQQPDDPAAAPPVQPAGRQPGYLGAVADDTNDRGRGVRILDVRPDGPAHKAGLRKQDLITALAGTRVRQMSDMADVLELFPAGESLTFDVLRDGKPQKIKVTLGRRPAPAVGPAEPRPETVPIPAPAAGAPPALPRTPIDPLGVEPDLQGPRLPDLPAAEPSQIEQLQRRIEQLERRVAELERALAETLKKP